MAKDMKVSDDSTDLWIRGVRGGEVELEMHERSAPGSFSICITKEQLKQIAENFCKVILLCALLLPQFVLRPIPEPRETHRLVYRKKVILGMFPDHPAWINILNRVRMKEELHDKR